MFQSLAVVYRIFRGHYEFTSLNGYLNVESSLRINSQSLNQEIEQLIPEEMFIVNSFQHVKIIIKG